MFNTLALAVGWCLCLGTQELLCYSCQGLRFAAFCSAGLVSRSDELVAQQRVRLSPFRGDPPALVYPADRGCQQTLRVVLGKAVT